MLDWRRFTKIGPTFRREMGRTAKPQLKGEHRRPDCPFWRLAKMNWVNASAN